MLVLLVACSAEPEIIEVTRIVEVPIEVTSNVSDLFYEYDEVEVTRLLEVEVTREVELTRLVEVEVTRLVEVLPTPETATISTAEPFDKYSSQEVADAFSAAGLEAENLRPMTRDDYGAAPFVGEGTRFL